MNKTFRYQHIYSSVDGKSPSADTLYTAEIAINGYPHNEHLFIKNSSGNVVSFDTTEEIDVKLANKLDASAYTPIEVSSALTSGDTNPVEGGAIYNAFAENELVVANALNALNDGKLDIADFQSYSGDVEIELNDIKLNKQDVLTAGSGISISGDVISSVVDQEIIEGSTNAVAGGAVFDKLNYVTTDYVTTSLTNSEMTDKEFSLGGEITNVNKIYIWNISTLDWTMKFGEGEDYEDWFSYTAGEELPTSDYATFSYNSEDECLTIQVNEGYEILNPSFFIFYGEGTNGSITFDLYGDIDVWLIDDYAAFKPQIETDVEILRTELSGKQDTLTAGTGIDITNNVISVTGGSGGGVTSGEVQTMIDQSISGKVDTSDFNIYSAATDIAMGNKQDVSGMTAYTQTTAFTAHTADTSIHHTATSAVTNGSTDVLTSGGAYAQFGGLKLVKLTQAQYDALSPNYDANTIYYIVN